MNETKAKIFKQMIFRNQLDFLPKQSAPKSPSGKLFRGLSKNQAVEKSQKIMNFALKFGHKIFCNQYDNKKSVFIKLSLNHRKSMLSKVAFEKIKILILKKNLDGIYTFFNKACPNKFRWKTVKNFEEKFGVNYKNWDFTRKNIEVAEINKIRKIIGDLSVSGNINHILKIDLSVIRIFLTEKYGIKILRLFYENYNKKLLLTSLFQMIISKETKKPPKILQNYIQKIIKEKDEIDIFLKKDKEVKNHKSHERILNLHNRELNMVSKKLSDPKSLKLRARENLILDNWAAQILNRIARFYRREYLINGFSRIYRKCQSEKYRRKVLMNLYERYRCARIRDVTLNFMRWKIKSFDFEKFQKIKALIVSIDKIVRKVKKSKFLDFLMHLPLKEGGNLIASRKVKSAIMILQIFEKKNLIILESVFRRIKEEDFLVEISEKIQGLEKILVLYEKTRVRTAFLTLRKDAEKWRKLKRLSRGVEFMFAIRKVVNFYKILAFAKFNKN